MNIKNVEYTNYNSYLESLVKSLSNFCSKCPLKPTIQVVKDLGKIYVRYDEDGKEITVDVKKDKKKIIGDLRKKLEKHYPIIYEKTSQVPNADEVRKILNQGKSLEEALNTTQTVYKKVYKIMRVHDLYNELDLFSIEDDCMYKFKCKIPLIALLEDLKYNGRDSDAITHLNLLYKLNFAER